MMCWDLRGQDCSLRLSISEGVWTYAKDIPDMIHATKHFARWKQSDNANCLCNGTLYTVDHYTRLALRWTQALGWLGLHYASICIYLKKDSQRVQHHSREIHRSR